MYHALIFILSISLITTTTLQSSLTFNPKHFFLGKHPLLNAYATKSGSTPIEKQGSELLVYVDFQNDYDEVPDFSYNQAGSQPMQLALYTSITLLSNGCLNFTSYDCSSYSSCTSSTDKNVSLSFPHFNASGHLSTSELYVDYTYFTLGVSPLIANSCSTQNINLNSAGKYGLVGMGTTGDARKNFKGFRPIFSVHIPQNGTEGTLLFRTDLSYAEDATPVAELNSDSNWHVSGLTNVNFGNYIYNSSAQLIFDMNAQAIGFPSDLYSNIILGLEESLQIICSADTSRPTCSYTGNVPVFPTIVISFGDQSIPISQEIYVNFTQSSESYVTLNLRGLNSSLTGESYIVPLYENYIILDSHVMTYYYSIFDGSNGNKITLYVANQNDDVLLVYYVLGYGGAIGVCCILCCFIACCVGTIKEKIKQETPTVVISDEKKTSGKEDLLHNFNTDYTLRDTDPSRGVTQDYRNQSGRSMEAKNRYRDILANSEQNLEKTQSFGRIEEIQMVVRKSKNLASEE